MYSIYNSNVRLSFLEKELGREFIDFPIEIDEAYSSVYNWLSSLNGMEGFDNRGQPSSLDPSDDPETDRKNTGREFTFFLPGHTLKTYKCLLDNESDFLDKGCVLNLGKPEIFLIDAGCGGGSASIALISLIINYQRFKQDNKYPIFPVKINVLGIDPNEFALEIYSHFLNECRNQIKELLIDVHFTIFPGTFSESTSRILEWVREKERIHEVLLIFGNVIRSFKKAFELRQKRRTILNFARNFLPDLWGRELGSEEIKVIESIFNLKNIDRLIISVIGSDTIDKSGKAQINKSWRVELNKFLRNFCRQIPSAINKGVERKNVSVIGPTKSYYRYRRNVSDPARLEFEFGYLEVTDKDYTNDQDWQKILSISNLRLAWARVRNEISYGMYEDSLEIRIFEVNIDERLEKLRNDVLNYDWTALRIEEMFEYVVPKGFNKGPRPLCLGRLEDQILATAIMQVKEFEFINRPRRSYAYKISSQNGEFLYKNWFQAYTRFREEARDVAKKNLSWFVIQTDISSYYTELDQKSLTDEFNHHTRLYKSRGKSIVNRLINRNLNSGEMGKGIPQGHIMSGLLANFYLSDIDIIFGDNNEWGIEYFRYVDDLIFIFPPSLNPEFLLNLLDEKLRDLGLIRAIGKTIGPLSTGEFLERTKPDDLLNLLDKNHKSLLSDLYKLDRNYISVCLNNWWQFMEHYHKLLSSLGVYVSVPRLSRKLRRNLNLWRKTFNWWKKLTMPKVKSLSDLERTDEWVSEFRKLNNEWITKLDDHIKVLIGLLSSSLETIRTLPTEEIESIRAVTRLKFSINRLGQLGYGAIGNEVVDLLVNQPWLLNIRKVALAFALQGREDLLINTLQRINDLETEEWGYVRSMLIKSFSYLGSVSDETLNYLRDIALLGKTISERIMATEVIFLLYQGDLIENSDLISSLEESTDNYLIKNYALLLSLNTQESPLKVDLSYSNILNEIIEYSRIVPDLEDLYIIEPDILRDEFYTGTYPDDFQEFPEKPSFVMF